MKIQKGCRMTCEVFERVFVPSFRNFSFHRAFKVAEKLLSSQAPERTATQLVRAYNQMQMIKKQSVGVKAFIAEHSQMARIECVIHDIIAISRNPSEYQTPCCDAGIDIFIHKNMIYAVPLSAFIKEYKIPTKVEDFSYSPENISPDWSLRKETWENLYKNGRMRMELINALKNIGVDEIKKRLLNPTIQNIKETTKSATQEPDIQAA